MRCRKSTTKKRIIGSYKSTNLKVWPINSRCSNWNLSLIWFALLSHRWPPADASSDLRWICLRPSLTDDHLQESMVMSPELGSRSSITGNHPQMSTKTHLKFVYAHPSDVIHDCPKEVPYKGYLQAQTKLIPNLICAYFNVKLFQALPLLFLRISCRYRHLRQPSIYSLSWSCVLLLLAVW